MSSETKATPRRYCKHGNNVTLYACAACRWNRNAAVRRAADRVRTARQLKAIKGSYED